jgi:hypothetical protein
VIAEYRTRIADLVAHARWNNPDLAGIVQESAQARQELSALRSSVTSNYSPVILQRTLTAFETQDARYRNLRFRLSRYTDVKELDEGLHISEVQSLGNVFKLPALFFERIGQVATYAYLLVAVCFDLLMVYLFQLVSANRVGQRAAAHSLGRAW